MKIPDKILQTILLILAILAVCGCEKHNVEETRIPDLYDYTNTIESGVKVLDYAPEEGRLEISVPKDKIPKVGDFLVSGITDEAPFGYMVKVMDVEVVKTKANDDSSKICLITVAGSVLYDVLHGLGVEVKQWFRWGEDLKYEGSAVMDDDGTTVVEGETPQSSSNGITIIDLSPTFKFEDATATFSKKISIDEFGVYLDATTPAVNIGLDARLKDESSFTVDAKGKLLSKKIDLYKEYVKKYVVKVFQVAIPTPAGPIPVVISVLVKPSIPVELSLSANAKAELYKKTTYFNFGGYFNTAKTEFYPLDGQTEYSYLTEVDRLREQQESQTISVSLDGKFSVNLDMECSVGLYGGNLIDHGLDTVSDVLGKNQDGKKIFDSDNYSLNYLSVGANLGYKLEMKSKLGAVAELKSQSEHPVRVIDEMKTSSYFYGKLWAAVVKSKVNIEFKKIDLSIGWEFELGVAEKEWKAFKKEYQNPFFFPYYDKLKIGSINNYGELNLTGKRYEPLFDIWNNPEGKHLMIADGFCVESNDGLDNWKFDLDKNCLSKHEDGGCNIFAEEYYDVNFDIPLDIDNLRRNTWYSIYPYFLAKFGTISNDDRPFCRQGISFALSEDGQMSTSDIDDIPGENL